MRKTNCFNVVWYLGALLALICVAQAGKTNPPATKLERVDFQILHFNDQYNIEGLNGGTVGGVSRLATIRKQFPQAFLIFSGDAFFPSYLSIYYKGQQVVETFNMLNITAAVVGNHEFDSGLVVAEQLFQQCNFPWLVGNLINDSTALPIAGLKPYRIVTLGNLKIAFIGLVGNWLVSTRLPEATYVDYASVAASLVLNLKTVKKVDVVIAITHAFNVDDQRLLQTISGIDLVLGGHDHDLIDDLHYGGRLIWKSESDLHYVGLMNVSVAFNPYDNTTKKVFQTKASLISLDGNVTQDNQTETVVQSYLSRISTINAQVAAVAGVDLDEKKTTVRTKESNFGNWVADRYIQQVVSIVSNSDNLPVVSGVNGGSIRLDSIITAGTNITKKMIMDSLPFSDTISAALINGTELWQVLENSVSQVELIAGRFLQISGMSYGYDPTKAAGSRLKWVKYSNGTTVQNDDMILFATNTYVLGGGDGYLMLANKTKLISTDSAQIDYDAILVMLAAMQEQAGGQPPVLSPTVEGRINVESSKKRDLLEHMESFSLETLEEALRERRSVLQKK